MITSILAFIWHQLPLASAATNTSSSNQTEDLWNTYFRRGTANVQWCEDVVASHAHHDWIAEYYNTWSNMTFCLVALVGFWRCRSDGLKWSFWTAESIMMMIGIGSFLFHAHQSKLAQVTDELPMVLLLLTQSHCLEDLHPSTALKEGKSIRPFYLLNHGFVLMYWIMYSVSDNYEIFLNGFGVQMGALFILGFDAGRRMEISQQKWICSFSAFAIGQGCWQLERYLYRTDSCHAPGIILLHPLWHLLAALSHMVMMSNYADLKQRINGGSDKASKQGKAD